MSKKYTRSTLILLILMAGSQIQAQEIEEILNHLSQMQPIKQPSLEKIVETPQDGDRKAKPAEGLKNIVALNPNDKEGLLRHEEYIKSQIEDDKKAIEYHQQRKDWLIKKTQEVIDKKPLTWLYSKLCKTACKQIFPWKTPQEEIDDDKIWWGNHQEHIDNRHQDLFKHMKELEALQESPNYQKLVLGK